MSVYIWTCVACGERNEKAVGHGFAFPLTVDCGSCKHPHRTFLPSEWEDSRTPAAVQPPTAAPSSVDALLVQRGNVHGDFRDNADHAKRFLDILKDSEETRRFRNQIPLTAVQYNAAVMICQKLSRILAGDAAFEDHWIDIQGYAKLGQKGDKP